MGKWSAEGCTVTSTTGMPFRVGMVLTVYCSAGDSQLYIVNKVHGIDADLTRLRPWHWQWWKAVLWAPVHNRLAGMVHGLRRLADDWADRR